MDRPDDHVDSPFDDEIRKDPLADGRASHEGHASHMGHGGHGSETNPRAQAAGYAPRAAFRDTPVCAGCGYDLHGVGKDAACPECGGRERKSYGHTPRCTFCNYTLAGLGVESNCPECGKPIWESNIQPPTSGLAIASMVCGIVGVLGCVMYGIPTLFLGPVAIVLGEVALRQHKRGERAGSTKGCALAGRICGWIGFVPAIVFWIGVVIAVAMSLI